MEIVTSAAVKNRINGTDIRGVATSTSTVLIEGKYAESLQDDIQVSTLWKLTIWFAGYIYGITC